MLEILNYSFFTNALIWWNLIAIIRSIIGVFIVIRREVQISHTISNRVLAGISLGLFLGIDYNIISVIRAIFASFIIFFINKTKLLTSDSRMELLSQIMMRLSIFLISYLVYLRIDITSLLFGNILAITKNDLYLLGIISLIWIIFFAFASKKLLAISISEELAKSKNINSNFYNLAFLILTALVVAFSIKIFWILLLGAFLILPSNIWKILANSIKKVFIFALIVSLIWVNIWLFTSYYLNTATWATIVLVLAIFLFFSIIFKKIIK